MDIKHSSKLLLVAVTLLFFLILLKQQQVILVKRTSIEQFVLPEQLKQVFSDKNLLKNWLLIEKNGNHIFYLPDSRSTEIGAVRLKIVLDSIVDLLSTGTYKIHDSIYLLSSQDGIVTPHKWPILAFASNKNLVTDSHVVLMPDDRALSGYSKVFKEIDLGISQFPWDQKISKVFWRGSTTGHIDHKNDIYSIPRAKFIKYAANLDYVDAAFTCITENKYKSFALKPMVRKDMSLRYKYLIDIDGNSCSYERMAWILYSNSVLMKHESNDIQWYYHKLKPYVNYIPINADFSNLTNQYLWAEANQQQAKFISKNANLLAREVFSDVGIRAALEQAFQQYYDITKTM